MKTYQKYLTKTFISLLLQITFVFFSLIIILSLFEEISYFKDLDAGFFYPIFLTFLSSPSVIYDIFPFIFLISTKFFFIKISEKNELNIYKRYGLTNFKILKLISLVSFLLGLLIVVFFYTFSSKLKHLHLEIKNSYSGDDKYLAVITENGLWIKDEIDNIINIVNADRINKNYLINVSITQFNKKFELIQNISSKKVDISKNNWVIKNANISKNNFTQKNVKNIIFKSHFDIEKINNLFSNLSSLTFLQLKKLKKDYKLLGYSTLDINTHLEKIYAYPIYLSIMTVFAGIIMLNIKFNKPKIFNIILGVILSVVIYYINYFSNLLGENGKISATLSVWMPLLILSLISSIGLVRINEK
ncbi:MAG: LptF/LptG family permease [Pelagibacterales bacterium]|nr:LptF/LptG family permease [Pelagibacterales bacterium]